MPSPDLEAALERAAVALQDRARALQYVRNVAGVETLEDVPADKLATVIHVLNTAAGIAQRDRDNAGRRERSRRFHDANRDKINAAKRLRRMAQ